MNTLFSPVRPALLKPLVRFVFSAAVSASSFRCLAQQAGDVINVGAVTRIESVLASDSLQGRATGTAGIDKAAAFLAVEFKKAGLQPFSGNSFLQPFVMVRARLKELKFKADGGDMDATNVAVFTSQEELKVDEKSGYAIAEVKPGERLMTRAMQLLKAAKNSLVLVDTSFRAGFPRLSALKQRQFKSSANVIFLLGNTLPKEFKLKASHTIEEIKLANVVGVLPGKSRKNEQVVFSAHYDHLGIGKPLDGDSIYNGANDDAAGTTAVVLLADYFHKLQNNERTLVFAAFTAEEIGGFGSQYFSQQLDPVNVAAMFNIEMIGTESKWGKNSAYITGYDLTSLGQVLQANLKGSGFEFYPDPYPQEQLFYRSDNATLARLGVPAHTISTAKMEGEPNYHRPSDEVKTLDLENMTQIIKAIAESSRSIIAGKDTPTRVKTESLR